MESGYQEVADPALRPDELALRHARGKLNAALRARTNAAAPVLCADTVVDVDGRAYGKPRDASDARAMLQTLSARMHEVHTAFALAYRGSTVAETATTRVTFFALGADEIEAYLRTGEPMDKAGAYGIQGYGATLVERIDGDFYTVVGLPLARLARSLHRLGFSIFPAN